MKAGGALRVLLASAAALAVLAAGWWLFADTVRYHSATDESTPLRLSFWGDFQEYEMWKEFLALWNRKHPDIPVNMEYITARYDPKMGQLLRADAAPDVFVFQDEPMPGFTAEGKFEDLTGYLNTPGASVDLKDFWKTSVDSFGRWETKSGRRTWHQYGIPVWGGCNLLFYNRRAFEKARIRVRSVPIAKGSHPPGLRAEGDGWVLNDEAWTIDEFVQVAQLLTVDEDGDGRTDQFGFMLPWSIYWLPWHWALEARVLDPAREKVAFLGPECERSLQLWQDLRFKYHVSPTPAELGPMGQNVGFLTGRIAMFCNGPWCMPFLNATDAPYGVLHTPRGPTGLRATRITWDAMVMSKHSKKKRQAWLLIHHLTGKICQELCAKVQRSIPARKSAAEVFATYNPDVEAGKFVQAAREYARMQPISVHWSILSRTWYRVSDSLLGDDPAERLTPAEAIGDFLSDKELRKVHPPTDEAQAERYRAIYRKRMKGGGQ